MFVREWGGEMQTSLWTMLPSSCLPWAGPWRLCLYGSYVDMLCVGPPCELLTLPSPPPLIVRRHTRSDCWDSLPCVQGNSTLSLWFFTCSSSRSSFSRFMSASHTHGLHPDAGELPQLILQFFMQSLILPSSRLCANQTFIYWTHIH